MFNRIMLLGTQDVKKFVDLANTVKSDVKLMNRSRNYVVDGKSYLGVLLAATEWKDDTWIQCDEDIYSLMEYFIVICADDAANVHE